MSAFQHPARRRGAGVPDDDQRFAEVLSLAVTIITSMTIGSLLTVLVALLMVRQ